MGCRALKAIDGGGMIFEAVRPRMVVLRPSGGASFGLNYGDAANQQDPGGAGCTVQNNCVALAVWADTLSQNYETIEDFNCCYTAFEVYVTSNQAGPLPNEGY
jgi:hypothetical protein